MMFTNLILLGLLIQTGGDPATNDELSKAIGPVPGVSYGIDRQTGGLTVIAPDGTKFVYDTQNQRQFVVSPDGYTSERPL